MNKSLTVSETVSTNKQSDSRESNKLPDNTEQRNEAPPTVYIETELYERSSAWRQLWALRNIIVVVLAPIVTLPLVLLADDKKTYCAYVIILIGVLWMTEVVPIAATSLLPFFLFPMAGILTAKQAAVTYMNDTSMLFFGGLTVAVVIETWNLHKRIALKVMMIVGSEPKWLLGGLMFVTWFLSMWISNTATAGMMIPIVHGILQQLTTTSGPRDNDEEHTVTGDLELQTPSPDHEHDHVDNADVRNSRRTDSETGGNHSRGKHPRHNAVSHERMHKALSLCICYSANIGGIASLTGTGPNLVLKGQSDIVFQNNNSTNPITFSTWLVFGLPVSLLVLVILWVWMQIFFFRFRGCCSCFSGKKDKNYSSRVNDIIQESYRKLGTITYAEKTIMVLFVFLVVLWITRDLGDVGGWGDIFESEYVSDSTPALLIAFLLFVFPSTLPNVFCFRKRNDVSSLSIKTLLTWKDVHDRMPWSVFLILGAGYCIAEASLVSGLSSWLGEQFEVFSNLDPYLMLLVLCYFAVFATEFTSNTAIATLMMPVMAQLSLNMNVNPLFFMLPTALTISFAFMLPVATPPNAIVFSYGGLTVLDMILCGSVMNIISAPVVVMATVSWGNTFFRLDTLPSGFINSRGTGGFANVTDV